MGLIPSNPNKALSVSKLWLPLEQCSVIIEQTGHYHKPLEQYLLELDLSVYVMHVQRRPTGLLKTDKRDALGLANHYIQPARKGHPGL